MGLVAVARYSVLIEEQVARSALASAGIPAVVMDEGQGAMNYLWCVMLQGFRLCVVESELEDARAILGEALKQGAQGEPSDIRPNPRTTEWIIAGLIPGILWGNFGLLVEATRRKPTFARAAFLLIAYTLMAIALIMGVRSCSQPHSLYPT